MKATESQIRALDTSRSLCVTAGAGAGKTWVLVERYLKLLKEGAKVSQILALTFTEKAAAEMRERVRKALMEKEGDDWKARLEEFNWCTISTFHSFCANLIRQYPMESGMPPRFQVMDDVSFGLMKEEAFQSLLRGEGAEHANESLVRALTLYGSWKLQERLEYMYEHRAEIAPWLQTHPTKEALSAWSLETAVQARKEMFSKFHSDKELQDAISKLSVLAMTHAGNNDTGQNYLAEVKPVLDNLKCECKDEEVLQNLLALYEIKGTSKMGTAKFFSKVEKAQLIESYQKLQSRLSVLGIDIVNRTDDDLVNRSIESLSDLIAIFGVYSRTLESAKKEQNAIDFADMIATVRTLVQNNEGIVTKLRQHYRYLLVDEFQDTDPIQSFIVWAVAGDKPMDRLFLVGDPKQSIYGFRNADVVMFQRAKGKLKNIDSESAVHLDINFRSSPQVVRFVNHVFAQLMHNDEEEYQFLYEPMELSPERINDNGSVELLLAEKKATIGPNEAAQLSEIDMVASRIKQLLTDGRNRIFIDKTGRRIAEGRKPEPGDIAILLRARTHLKLFENALRDRNIPYHVHKGLGFFERQEIMDVYNVLCFLADNSDDVALYGILRSPYFAFSDEELYFISRAPGFDLWKRLHNMSESGDQHAKQASSMLESWSKRSGRVPVSELLRKIQSDSGIYAVYAAQSNSEQLLSNIEKLNTMLRDSPGDGICSPHQAVDWMEKAMRLAKLEGEAPMESSALNAVNIMTVHASKGLEFPIVVVPELGRGEISRGTSIAFDEGRGLGITVFDSNCETTKDLVFSLIEKEEKARSDEEFKRLLYVAMTRARDHLILSGHIGSEERKVVTWMDHLLSTMPNGAIPEGVSRIAITSDVDMDILRPNDLLIEGDGSNSLKPFTLDAGMEELVKWEAVPRPRRNFSFTATGLKSFESYPERFIRRNVYGVPEGWLEENRSTEAMAFGTAVHEVLRGRDPATVAEQMGIESRRLKELEQIRANFDNVISNRSDGTAYRELRFEMMIGNHLFHGVIDRLDRTKQGNWLVTDFKTDSDAAASNKQLVENHQEQVRAYMLASQKALGADVEGSLYYTNGSTTIDVGSEIQFEEKLAEKIRECSEAIQKIDTE